MVAAPGEKLSSGGIQDMRVRDKSRIREIFAKASRPLSVGKSKQAREAGGRASRLSSLLAMARV